MHRAKAANITADLRPEAGAEATKAYASYEEALSFFLETVNVVNTDEHFPDWRGPGFPAMEGTET